MKTVCFFSIGLKQYFSEFSIMSNFLTYFYVALFLECDICKKPFKNVNMLKKHRETHSDERIAYFCQIQECGR